MKKALGCGGGTFAERAGRAAVLWCSFTTVQGLTGFDLETFLAVVERSHKWQCPTSMKNATVHELQVDAFTQHILHQLKVPPSRSPHAQTLHPGDLTQSCKGGALPSVGLLVLVLLHVVLCNTFQPAEGREGNLILWSHPTR